MNVRQGKIIELLRQNGEVSVQDLAERLDVTTMTIRRDLDTLEQKGELVRTHGGAVLTKAGIIEFAFKRKGEKNAEEKRLVAEEAANFIRPGMTVALDTGTTCLEVAKAISGTENLTVLTSSLAIGSALYAADHIDLVLLGGKARRGSPDLTGWLTEENLRHFRVDIAVLGADGVSRDGVYTRDESVARVSKAMIACAGSALLVIDHTKFRRPAFIEYAEWKDFDHIVTDAGVSAKDRKWLSRVATEVNYAKA